MYINFKMSFTILSTLSLLACAEKSKISILDKPLIKYKVNKVADTVSNIPKWYLIPPKDTSKVYSVGAAVSPDIQLSLDMATMNAKYTLADRINGKMDGLMKTFVTKLGDDQISSSTISDVQKATKNIISSVDVAGYQPKEIKVNSSGTQYQAYVLLEYSEETAKQVVMNRIMKNQIVFSKINSTNAWKELERESDTSKNNLN